MVLRNFGSYSILFGPIPTYSVPMDCKSGDVTQPEVSISLVQTNIADLGS